MQKPIRYYITKSGDEPTVRSVQVALPAPDRAGDAEGDLGPTQPPAAIRTIAAPKTDGKRRVKDALRGRAVEE